MDEKEWKSWLPAKYSKGMQESVLIAPQYPFASDSAREAACAAAGRDFGSVARYIVLYLAAIEKSSNLVTLQAWQGCLLVSPEPKWIHPLQLLHFFNRPQLHWLTKIYCLFAIFPFELVRCCMQRCQRGYERVLAHKWALWWFSDKRKINEEISFKLRFLVRFPRYNILPSPHLSLEQDLTD